MNKIAHQKMVQECVKDKFKGRESIEMKVKPRYPAQAEREFKRVTNAYMKLINQTLKAHLPAIIAAYKQERMDSRYDSILDFDTKLKEEFQKIFEELEQKTGRFGLDTMIEKLSKLVQASSLREWKRLVKKTFGIDLLDDYYNGEFYGEALRKWVDENIMKIKTIPRDTLGSMQDIILEGYKAGRTIRDVSKDIQKSYDVSKSRAYMLARDQIGSLNAAITKYQQQDAGIKRYKWSSSGDERVRDCHAALDGQIFNWDDPPEMWYITKSRGMVHTGRYCNPGEDYQCRCVALAVVDLETLDLPIKQSKS